MSQNPLCTAQNASALVQSRVLEALVMNKV